VDWLGLEEVRVLALQAVADDADGDEGHQVADPLEVCVAHFCCHRISSKTF
jgi:hypothetical protein